MKVWYLVRYALTGLLLAIAVLHGNDEVLAASHTLRLAPSADTGIVASNPTYSETKSTTLYTNNYGGGSRRRAFMQFDLIEWNGASEDVSSATVKVYVTSGLSNVTPSVSLSLYAIANDNWNESSPLITWNNVDDFPSGGLLGTQVIHQLNNWHTFDVTNYIRDELDSDSGRKISFYVASSVVSTGNYYRSLETNAYVAAASTGIASREATANQPELSIVYASDLPPTPALSLSGSPTVSSVPLQWTSSDGADTYKLYRKRQDSPEPFGLVYSGTALSYTDSNASFGTAYAYKISAANGYGESPFSEALPVETPTFFRPVVPADAVFYVDGSSGDDYTGDGTLVNPWKTIKRAADVMHPGDKVEIFAGVYRETVRPRLSGTDQARITYTNYDGGTVVISGLEPVGNWQLEGNGIYYSSDMNWSLNDRNQLFADGEPLTEAKWPNNPDDNLYNPGVATVDDGTIGGNWTLTSEDLINGDWSGASMWFAGGQEWIAQTTKVTDYDPDTKTLSFTVPFSTTSNYIPAPGNRFFLYGKKSMLDAEKEWWYDTVTESVYLMPPGNVHPSTLQIEAKQRLYALDMSGRSYIDIVGLQLFGAAITSDDQTSHLRLNNIKSEYAAHTYTNDAGMAGSQLNLGHLIKGSYNEITDSEFAYSSAAVLEVDGSNHRIVNNLIRDGNYAANARGVVSIRGLDQLLSHNTIYNSARDVVVYGGMKGGSIQYNHIYNAGYLTKDVGVLYGASGAGMNGHIRYNWVHDNHALGKADGIYLDNATNHMIVHHNVVWNIPGFAIRLNTPSNFNLVYNNTTYGRSNMSVFGLAFPDDMYGTKIFNNLFTDGMKYTDSAVLSGNVTAGDPEDLFVDHENGDFRLRPGSAAIDAGTRIPGITDGYFGLAPDVGAYETGAPHWMPGHNFMSPPGSEADYPDTNVEYIDYVANGTFGYGDLRGWTQTGVAPAQIKIESSWNVETASTRTGSQSVQLFGTSSIGQVVTGLRPNTTYQLSAWVRVANSGADEVTLGVSAYGGAAATATFNSMVWHRQFIDFTTGPTDTSAAISVSKTAGSGSSFVDDIGLIIKPVYPKPDESPTASILAPSDDTYVEYGANSDVNYNSSAFNSQLILKNAVGPNVDGAYLRDVLLKFDLSEVELDPELIHSAKLRLYASSVELSPNGIPVLAAIYAAESNWSESTVTANTLPVVDTNQWLDAVEMESRGVWYEFDLKSYIEYALQNEMTSLSFFIKDVNEANSKIVFVSSESGSSANKPVLEILTAPVLSLNKKELTLYQGASASVAVSFLPVDAEDQSVFFVSENTDMVTITQAVPGITPSATITASSVNSGVAHIYAVSDDPGSLYRTYAVVRVLPANDSALIAAIAAAETLYAEAEEGASPGQYAPGSKAVLLAAIRAAKLVRDNPQTTQLEADDAFDMLTDAVDEFEYGKV